MTKHMVIDLFEDAEELDALGPWEVFSYWTQHHPEDGWAVDLVSDDGQPRRCAKGLQVIPTKAKHEVPEPDVILEPGGMGSRIRMRDANHLDWLRGASPRGALVASVCTGARVLAAAGLLHGRPATTHHTALDDLASIDPTIHVIHDQRWVDDGQVITAAGVSAGIDMALHLVGRLAGAQRALQVQDGIEYHPAPPIWDGLTQQGAR